jgi:hypothetical protein
VGMCVIKGHVRACTLEEEVRVASVILVSLTEAAVQTCIECNNLFTYSGWGQEKHNTLCLGVSCHSDLLHNASPRNRIANA